MIELKNISRNYSDDFGFTVNLLNNISISLPDTEICSIIAPSGSGKSALLKIIAGLESYSSGELFMGELGRVLYIPSEPSSFPWLNVNENILMGIKDKRNVDVNSIAKLVGLEGYENHYPNNKSLGFRFRISLATAIAQKPSLIVIDEPFNKMDEGTRSELYLLIRSINKVTKISFLFACTNISEAIFLSDKIYLMKKNPGEIFENLSNTLSSERDMRIFFTQDFIRLREQIETSFKSQDSQKLFAISI